MRLRVRFAHRLIKLRRRANRRGVIVTLCFSARERRKSSGFANYFAAAKRAGATAFNGITDKIDNK
jgi:hypothetical protein